MALILDGTTGVAITDSTQPLSPGALTEVLRALIPVGTKMMFVQTAAPTGWTKDTTHNNKALRVVSGTAGTGGTVAFSTAFASKAVSGSIANTTAGGTVNNTTLSTAQMPSHTHNITWARDYNTPGSVRSIANVGNHQNVAMDTEATGGNGAHNHSFSGSAHNHSFTGTAIDMAVQYVDVIICTKQ